MFIIESFPILNLTEVDFNTDDCVYFKILKVPFGFFRKCASEKIQNISFTKFLAGKLTLGF